MRSSGPTQLYGELFALRFARYLLSREIILTMFERMNLKDY